MNTTLALSVSFSRKHCLSLPNVVLVLEGALFVLLLILYVFHIQQIIKTEYQLDIYQKEAQELVEETQSLQGTVFLLSSLAKAEKVAKELGFVRVNKVKYLPLASGSLARNIK